METVVQTPPSYSRSGTGPRNPEPGSSGLSSQQRRGQAASATSAGCNRNRGGPAEGGVWARKRRGSFGMNSTAGTGPGGAGPGGSNSGPHDNPNPNNNRFKRRKRQHPDIVLPTKFMLGGSITDPLNLRSLENEEVNRLANQTPVASPAPAAGGGSERVEVIIPRDINDPLNLNAPEPPPTEANSDQNSQQANSNSGAGSDSKRRESNNKPSSQSPVKKNRRRRNRNNHHNAYGRFTGGSAWRGGPGGPPGPDAWARPGTSGGQRFVGGAPGAPGSGRGGRGFRPGGSSQAAKPATEPAPKTTPNQQKDASTSNGNKAANGGGPNASGNSKTPGAKPGGSNNQRFRYGNYNRYYGYRNGADGDSRLPLLKRKWFENKVCLDVGCNVGHVTLSVARDHAPREIIGMDIDPALIRIARKNVRHYVHEENVQGRWFPDSCAITFGPIAMAPVGGADAGPYSGRASNRQLGAGPPRDGASTSSQSNAAPFPYNIFFTRGNYVLDNDDLLETQREEFDTIMCLSTSKWIQLNFGDEGLKRTFKRVYRQLRPGGRFVFEPQPLSSYHKFCTPEHRENFRKMQLKPDEFPDYLTREVGFASCKILGVGNHGAKNFQRPLFLLRKGVDASRERSGEEQSNTPNSSSACGEKSTEKKPESKEDEYKDTSTSTPNATDDAETPSPAHECDTTTASI